MHKKLVVGGIVAIIIGSALKIEYEFAFWIFLVGGVISIVGGFVKD
jgi:hypothetical protein